MGKQLLGAQRGSLSLLQAVVVLVVPVAAVDDVVVVVVVADDAKRISDKKCAVQCRIVGAEFAV